MKKYINKKFRPALLGALGAIAASIVIVLMVTGDLQKHIKFAGVGEEIVFTFFALLIGIISLGMSVSCLSSRE